MLSLTKLLRVCVGDGTLGPQYSDSTRCLRFQLAKILPLTSKTRQQHDMKRILLVIVVVALYILHQDFWFWRTAHPMVFGFIPIGLFYQACFSVAASLVMWLLVKYAWPAQLEREIEERDPEEESAH